jgi:hypothetical protein
MPNYVVTGKNASGEPLVSLQLAAINQEQPILDDIDVVDALRTFLLGRPEVESVVAQRYEQVITVI